MISARSLLGLFLLIAAVLAVFFYRNEVLSFVGLVRSLDYEKLDALQLENLALKTELEALREGEEIIGDSHLTAKIYSRYPWNDRRLIIVNLGKEDGVRSGMPVVARERVLLGKVKTVFVRQSVVETIFDPAWRSSVVIEPGTKALLEGGPRPTLTLISKESAVASGARVFNTSPEFPLGLLLGEVREAELAPDGVWLRAPLETLYVPENLSEVLIITNFP
ncbi:MAG: hypothetical protein HY378_00895 [Candidatus Brennerbacteria bacterium]|nr:hypothetical protein [Candidatus Brennerbacteria bacterium]